MTLSKSISLPRSAYFGTTSPGRAALEKSTVCKASGLPEVKPGATPSLLCICPACFSSIFIYLLPPTVGALRLTVAFLKLLFHRLMVKIIPKLTKGLRNCFGEGVETEKMIQTLSEAKSMATTRVCFLLCLTRVCLLASFCHKRLTLSVQEADCWLRHEMLRELLQF